MTYPGWDIRPYVTISPPSEPASQASTDAFLHLGINHCQTGERFKFDFEAYRARNLAARALELCGLTRFPPELVAMIVSCILPATSPPDSGIFSEDLTETYKQCVLVCHSWSTTFRPLILKDIVITQASQLRRLYEIFLLSPTIQYHGRALVRTISVKPGTSPAEHEPPCLELVLASPLPRTFVNLAELHSFDADSISKEPARVPPHVQLALPALLRPLQRLTHLHMTGTRFRSFAQLLSIIRAVQAPSHIRLDDVSILRQGPVRAASLTAARARLQRLSFRSTQVPLELSVASPIAKFVVDLHVLRLVDITANDITAIINTFQDLLRLFQDPNRPEDAQQHFTDGSLELQFLKFHERKSPVWECLDFSDDVALLC